jgi:hypothetical protein
MGGCGNVFGAQLSRHKRIKPAPGRTAPLSGRSASSHDLKVTLARKVPAGDANDAPGFYFGEVRAFTGASVLLATYYEPLIRARAGCSSRISQPN